MVTPILFGARPPLGEPHLQRGRAARGILAQLLQRLVGHRLLGAPEGPDPGVVPLGKWMCWEWSFDAGNNDMQFFSDGTLYRHVAMTGDGCLTGNGVWVAPPDFGMVGIGANIAEIQPTVMQMWFDDIAVGTTGRIGCPAP